MKAGDKVKYSKLYFKECEEYYTKKEIKQLSSEIGIISYIDNTTGEVFFYSNKYKGTNIISSVQNKNHLERIK